MRDVRSDLPVPIAQFHRLLVNLRLESHVFEGGDVAGWPQRTGLRCLARVERLVEEGDGSGVGNPGSLTAAVGNLPALRDQRAPAAVDADLPGRCAFSADLDARANPPARSPPQSSFDGARCHADRLRRAGPNAPRAASSKGGRVGVRAS